jgi:competence ComEA-like helix-hairpin-helix protein
MTDGSFEQLKEGEQERIQSFGFAIGASVCMLLCLGLAASTVAELRPSRRIQLESRINPNDAPLASLVRLPGIGMARAEAIATYRKRFSGQDDSGPAFETAEDLQKVKGIGPKTVQDISQWLKFE